MSVFKPGAPRDNRDVRNVRESYAVVFDSETATVSPQPYELGSRVTRDNWNDCLITSFAMARGSMDAHVVFFAWLEETTGLDVQQTFSSFMEQGGFDALTHKEQDQFLTAHNQVRKHLYQLQRMYEHYAELEPKDLYVHFQRQIEALHRHIQKTYDTSLKQVEGSPQTNELRDIMKQAYDREKGTN